MMTNQYREDSRSGQDRRHADDRRQSDQPVAQDQRSGDSRRQEGERRLCNHDIIYKTGNTLPELEGWLENNVEGQWDIALMDLTTSDLSTNIFRVMFERESDRELFRAQKLG